MNQRHSSKGTSINSKKLPILYTKLKDVMDGRKFIDIGCGKYINNLARFATEHNSVAFFMDPYNRTDGENIAAICGSRNAKVNFALCSNVLNVIDSDTEVTACIAQAVNLGNGIAFFSVYEGDGKGVGKETGWDKWQRNQKLREYEQYVPSGMRVSFYNGVMTVRRNHE